MARRLSSSWSKILFFVCHSQDFMNEVCTHIVRLDATYKKLRYFSGNFDTYVQTRRDQDMVQIRQYEAEQRDINEIKDFIARFGHGTVKMVRQAQAREKLLEKKLEAGLTEMPEVDPEWDWSFPDAGELPVPVLSIERLSFNYPGGVELYSNVDFGVDLQTRVALVGPNGAGTCNICLLGNPPQIIRKKAQHLTTFPSFGPFHRQDDTDQVDDWRLESNRGSRQEKYASEDLQIYAAF